MDGAAASMATTAWQALMVADGLALGGAFGVLLLLMGGAMVAVGLTTGSTGRSGVGWFAPGLVDMGAGIAALLVVAAAGGAPGAGVASELGSAWMAAILHRGPTVVVTLLCGAGLLAVWGRVHGSLLPVRRAARAARARPTQPSWRTMSPRAARARWSPVPSGPAWRPGVRNQPDYPVRWRVG